MRVIVPYTLKYPIVQAFIKKECPQVEFIQMHQDEDYWKLMCEIWEAREDVVINEHDVLPWPTAINELASCPFDWCSYTYEMKQGYGIHHAFGCTKLGAGLMDKLPDVWTQVESVHWRNLDAQLCEIAKTLGITPHPHRPPVIHLKGLHEAS